MNEHDIIERLQLLDAKGRTHVLEVLKDLVLRDQTAAARTVTIGSKIRLISTIRPRMLAGATAVVVGKMGDKLLIDIPANIGRWSRGVRVRASHVAEVIG